PVHVATDRLSLTSTSKYPKPVYPAAVAAVPDVPVELDNAIAQEGRHIIWRAPPAHKEPPRQPSGPPLHRRYNALPEAPVRPRGSRGRRHANGGGGRGHGHLMRVGCVLGTCQVQNLSHRLYQLIGQSGREDSSPINPRSPHSYG
uniref:Adrenomedullin 2b n=1 Tax=Salarias fasciatus TaxID=181472 RepID=A0A672IIA6_SALFA